MINLSKIVVRRVWFDWVAYHPGEKNHRYVGWGYTKEAAIADLLRLDVDRRRTCRSESWKRGF